MPQPKSIDIPDSCMRLVYAHIAGTPPQTQTQLSKRTGFSQTQVYRGLRFLIAEGYVRPVGTTMTNRYGTSTGRRQNLYVHTGKELPPSTVHDPSEMRSMEELESVMADIVRLRLI